MDWFGQIVIGIATAAVASWITVQLSLRQFYQEKWWSKKFETYTALIDTLYEMKRTFAEHWVMQSNPSLKGAYPELSRARLTEQCANVGRAIDVGEFQISKESIVVLRGFVDQLDRAGKLNDADSILTSLTAIREILPKVVDCARSDLGLKPWLALNS
jgi:hypothetical protein